MIRCEGGTCRCTLADWLCWGPDLLAKGKIDRVELTDRAPRAWPEADGSRGYDWALLPSWSGEEPRHLLPHDVFEMLGAGLRHGARSCYASERAATDALSLALLRWAREILEMRRAEYVVRDRA